MNLENMTHILINNYKCDLCRLQTLFAHTNPSWTLWKICNVQAPSNIMIPTWKWNYQSALTSINIKSDIFSDIFKRYFSDIWKSCILAKLVAKQLTNFHIIATNVTLLQIYILWTSHLTLWHFLYVTRPTNSKLWIKCHLCEKPFKPQFLQWLKGFVFLTKQIWPQTLIIYISLPAEDWFILKKI